MTNEELQIEVDTLKREMEDMKYLLSKKTGSSSAEIRGRIVAPSSVQATIAAGSIGKTELKYETADITISGASTSGTATVTLGSIPVGYFLTAFTTPNASYVQLVVSGTTLTATLSTAPAGANSITIRCFLMKA